MENFLVLISAEGNGLTPVIVNTDHVVQISPSGDDASLTLSNQHGLRVKDFPAVAKALGVSMPAPPAPKVAKKKVARRVESTTTSEVTATILSDGK